jgi:N-acetylglucosamine kinase-like BadF-type ATPase
VAVHTVNPGIFIGVDSGGTRTNVEIQIINPNGEAIKNNYEVGESLSGALPPDLIHSELRKILARLEVYINNHDVPAAPAYLWISAAGFTPWTRDKYLVAMHELLPTLIEGRIQCGGAANDGVSLLLGSRAHGIVIAGTGSTVFIRSSETKIHQAGGNEWVASDEGSGFWISIRGIREAYRDYEAGVDSVLLQRFRQTYDVHPEDQQGLIKKIRGLAVGHKDMKKEIARFAANVCAAAERGDKGAQNIVKAAAEGLADVTAEAIRRCFTHEEISDKCLRIVQCGGLLSNDFYRMSFEGQLKMRLISGDSKTATLDWCRVITGTEAAVRLAGDISSDPDKFLKLEPAFRPAIDTKMPGRC